MTQLIDSTGIGGSAESFAGTQFRIEGHYKATDSQPEGVALDQRIQSNPTDITMFEALPNPNNLRGITEIDRPTHDVLELVDTLRARIFEDNQNYRERAEAGIDTRRAKIRQLTAEIADLEADIRARDSSDDRKLKLIDPTLDAARRLRLNAAQQAVEINRQLGSWSGSIAGLEERRNNLTANQQELANVTVRLQRAQEDLEATREHLADAQKKFKLIKAGNDQAVAEYKTTQEGVDTIHLSRDSILATLNPDGVDKEADAYHEVSNGERLVDEILPNLIRELNQKALRLKTEIAKDEGFIEGAKGALEMPLKAVESNNEQNLMTIRQEVARLLTLLDRFSSIDWRTADGLQPDEVLAMPVEAIDTRPPAHPMRLGQVTVAAAKLGRQEGQGGIAK